MNECQYIVAYKIATVAYASHFNDVLLHGQLAVQMKTQVTDDSGRLDRR